GMFLLHELAVHRESAALSSEFRHRERHVLQIRLQWRPKLLDGPFAAGRWGKVGPGLRVSLHVRAPRNLLAVPHFLADDCRLVAWANRRAFRIASAMLLAASVFSATFPHNNPWQQPWVMNVIEQRK